MARVLILNPRTDNSDNVVDVIVDGLSKRGHEIVDPKAFSYSMGKSISEYYIDAFKHVDVIVMLFLAKATASSEFTRSLMQLAVSFAESSGSLLCIPVIDRDVSIPSFVENYECVFVNDDIESTLDHVDAGINRYIALKSTREQERKAVAESLKTNSDIFITDAINSLKSFERWHWWIGVWWNIIGFGALVGGVWFAYDGLATTMAPDIPPSRIAFISVKCLIIVTLLAASAKYAFSLGKSYTAEALRASDRVHAISFGRFYLRAFGAKATWAEIKEAFQNWNIDRRSSFSELDCAQFDPKLLESIAHIVEAAASNKSEKTKKS